MKPTRPTGAHGRDLAGAKERLNMKSEPTEVRKNRSQVTGGRHHQQRWNINSGMWLGQPYFHNTDQTF